MWNKNIRGKAYFTFILIGVCAIPVFASKSVAPAVGRPWEESPTVFELRLPPKDFPNPHSPFWVSPQELGFVTEEQMEEGTRGAVFIYDLQTKGVRKLMDRPVLSPTRLRKEDRLSFVAPGKYGVVSLFTMSLAGGDIREFDFGGSPVFDPSWSPDDTKVVFAGSSYNADLLLADGRTEQILPHGGLGRSPETVGSESPDWCPDGQTIVYIGWDKGSKKPGRSHAPTISRLYTFDLTSKKNRALTPAVSQDRYPACAPDGRRIVFVSDRSGDAELWIISSDGKNLRRVTSMTAHGQQVVWEKPAWNQDQSRIAFSATPSDPGARRDRFPFEGSKVWILQVR